jgi:hypothetical protein
MLAREACMTFEQFIDWLAAVSAIVTAVNIYLMINKIWSRKHIKDVAQSISVAAYSLSFVLAVPFFIKFLFFEADYVSTMVYGLWMGLYVIFVLIGAGVWIAGEKRSGFFAKFWGALRTEKGEIGTLILSLSRPQAADIILRILEGVACIDKNFDDKERKLIKAVTSSWGMVISDEEFEKMARSEASFQGIRTSVSAYLQTKPSTDEASQLLDLINHMITADETESEEESLLYGEIEGLIGSYVSGEDGQGAKFELLVVPQPDDEPHLIKDVLSGADLSPVERLGGFAYPVGTYFSEAFAETVARPIRSKRLFAVVCHLGRAGQELQSEPITEAC